MIDPREHLSALLDNELEPHELDALAGEIAELPDAEVAFSQSSRYQMIGEAMRRPPADAALLDISAQVRQAIEMETLASSSEVPAAEMTQPTSTPWFDLSAWFRPLGGFAVAATVAMVTVFVVTQQEAPLSGDASHIAGTSNSASQLPAVNIPDDALVLSVPVSVPPAQLVFDQKAGVTPNSTVNLDAYLAEHAEFAAQDTMQGRMPYVRAVSYRSE